jgi:hypothetical protein
MDDVKHCPRKGRTAVANMYIDEGNGVVILGIYEPLGISKIYLSCCLARSLDSDAKDIVSYIGLNSY